MVMFRVRMRVRVRVLVSARVCCVWVRVAFEINDLDLTFQMAKRICDDLCNVIDKADSEEEEKWCKMTCIIT